MDTTYVSPLLDSLFGHYTLENALLKNTFGNHYVWLLAFSGALVVQNSKLSMTDTICSGSLRSFEVTKFLEVF
jgi:hypothetical protein